MPIKLAYTFSLRQFDYQQYNIISTNDHKINIAIITKTILRNSFHYINEMQQQITV